MFRNIAAFAILLSFLFVADDASATKMKSFWKNPAATAASMQCKNVLVIVPIKQSLTRKVAEDQAVREIESGGEAHAVPSYTLIPEQELDDKEGAKSKISAMGFDGVIVIKYAGSEDAKKYDDSGYVGGPPSWYSYESFWGYWGTGWGSVYNATTTNDLKVFMETLFYSLKDNQLVWAGVSETKNPKNPSKVVAEIAEEVAKHLQKEGLIAKKKK